MSDGIELDVSSKKAKSDVSVWMLLLTIVAFGCFTATIVLQYLEYAYMRGQMPNETDIYSGQVLIPEQN